MHEIHEEVENTELSGKDSLTSDPGGYWHCIQAGTCGFKSVVLGSAVAKLHRIKSP